MSMTAFTVLATGPGATAAELEPLLAAGLDLVPADAARRLGRDGRVRHRGRPLEQSDDCLLRVSNNREAAHIRDVSRLDIDGATEAPRLIGRGIHVVNPDAVARWRERRG